MSCPSRLSIESRNGLPESKNQKMTYDSYLMLGRVLDSQQLALASTKPIHDEHLFIVSHQAFELWLKQILFELDSVRSLFAAPVVDESKTLVIINRLQRISEIMKVLVDQFAIVETMTPLDFMDLRKHMIPASGNESVQFRLLEKKLGVLNENRVSYDNQGDTDGITDGNPQHQQPIDASDTPSLLDMVMRWLERTPGLLPEEFDFWRCYKTAVRRWLDVEFYQPAKKESDPEMKRRKMESFETQQEIFQLIIDEDLYNAAKERGEHRFSHQAFQGAMMIALYRDEPRFHQPFQIFNALMDIDSLLARWRHNHLMLVQRMIGSEFGSFSSGCQYLQSTLSDRYKVFLDLFNLSTYLIPRNYIPPLTRRMKQRLSMINTGEASESSLTALMMRMQNIEDEDCDANMMSLSMI